MDETNVNSVPGAEAIPDSPTLPISEATDSDALREQIRQELTPKIRAEYQTQLDQAKLDLETKLTEQNKTLMERVVADFKRNLTPPSQDEIQQMLDAEFLEFFFKLKWNGEVKNVTLNELPAKAERKFVRLVKDKLLPKFDEFGKLLLELSASPAHEQTLAQWGTLEPIADVIESTVALILSETGAFTGTEVTEEAVRDNVSLNRQFSIIMAQVNCNRIRDFFSNASRFMRTR